MKQKKLFAIIAGGLVLLTICFSFAVVRYANRFEVNVYDTVGIPPKTITDPLEKARVIYAIRWTENSGSGVEQDWSLRMPHGGNIVQLIDKNTRRIISASIHLKQLFIVEEERRLMFYDAPVWVRKTFDRLYRKVNPTYDAETPKGVY